MDAFSTAEPFRYSADAAAASCADSAQRSDADRLVRDTKREIQQLVQEIAALCHARIAQRQFWPRFLDRLAMAMASEGGIVWQRREGDWHCVAHHGAVDRRLLHSLDAQQGRTRPPTCHTLMIREVGDGGGPVIVPPGAPWDPDVPDGSQLADAPGAAVEPGNPTPWLAAVVPIPVDPDEPVEWMIELFLPLGGGPATQRGYLRFAAQMADLAADYLRSARLRDARARADAATRAHIAIAAWAGAETQAAAEQQIVDVAADLFAAERVSLVRRRGTKMAVVAVSGVGYIDPLSPAVGMIREMAAQTPTSVGFVPSVIDCEEAAPHVETQRNDSSAAASDTASDSDDSDGQLTLRGVAILDPRGNDRLVVEDLAPVEVDPHQQQNWKLFIGHAAALLRQWERVGRAGWFGRLKPSVARDDRGPIRRLAPWGGIAVVLFFLAWLPVPMVVTAEARLEPRSVQTVYAPRDAVVADLETDHGSSVQPGDVLLRLLDRELDRSVSGLLGRRAVLSERSIELRAKLVSRERNDTDEVERLQTEQRVTDEELRSVDAELEVLREERQRLVLRSDREGIVDAWQVHERLENRPVRRGESLLRVVAPSGGWVIEADVPQNRLDHVIAGSAESPLRANVVLSAFPDHSLEGHVETVGPASRSQDRGEPIGTVLVSIDVRELPLLQAGAPASVGFHCGHRPLAYVACHDLVRMVLGAWRLYW